MATKFTYTGWKDLPTLQSKEILNELMECKEYARAAMIISNTGIGKTHTLRLFKKNKPENTYLVTMGDTYNLLTTMNALLEQLGLSTMVGKNAKHYALKNIGKRIAEISKEADEVPVVIIDEAENCKLNTLKAFKELYDIIIPYCSMVLIGTDQLIDAMEKRGVSMSVPQLKRRFKAGTRYVSAINKARDFKKFFELYVPDNKDVQDLLLEVADNYGELHDYLDPVLRHCAKKNIELTEDVFRMFHKLPKQDRQLKMKRA
jgi:DNA transposition AAA+ family ATPase